MVLSFATYDLENGKWEHEWAELSYFSVDVDIFYLKKYFTKILLNIKSWVSYPEIQSELLKCLMTYDEGILPCNTVRFMEEE